MSQTRFLLPLFFFLFKQGSGVGGSKVKLETHGTFHLCGSDREEKMGVRPGPAEDVRGFETFGQCLATAG